MNILIAPDSFKHSLDATEVCCAIESGFRQIYPNAHYILLPMADGGEGTSTVLSKVLGGQWQDVRVHDPLMRPIIAKYLLLPDQTAVIEIAQACGLPLLTDEEKNPLITSSYGVGELITDALDKGVTRFIIGLGGSATNDAGLGMLMALGMRFYHDNGKPLGQGGNELATLERLDSTNLHPKLRDAVFDVACDVSNPLCGIFGASYTFAPQKGANAEQVALLDKSLQHFATVSEQNGYRKCRDIAGSGAAGGLGFALMTFCNATLKSGFDTVANAVHLSAYIADADLIITGEGKLDAQSAMGKVTGGISQLAKAEHKPVIAICGSVDRLPSDQITAFDVVMPSIQKPDTINQILKDAYINVEITARNVAATIKLAQDLK